MFNRGISEALGQCLHHSLLERIVLGEMLSESHAQVMVFALEAREETVISDGKTQVLWGVKL